MELAGTGDLNSLKTVRKKRRGKTAKKLDNTKGQKLDLRQIEEQNISDKYSCHNTNNCGK